MAIALDVNSFKTQGTNTGTVTTNAFTTAATNELLVAIVICDGGASPTFTVSGAGLTWTNRIRSNPASSGSVEVWTAVSPGVLTAQTVTATSSNGISDCSIQLLSFTGADLIVPIGGSVTQNNTSNPAIVTLTTKRNNSFVFAAAVDVTINAVASVGTSQTLLNQFTDANDAQSHIYWQQTSAIPTYNTQVTMNLTSNTSDHYNMLAFEVGPPAPAETFTEDWETGSISAATWTAFLFGESVISNGGFVLKAPSTALTTNYSGVNTLATFDLTGSYVQSQLKYAGDQTIASWQAEPINFSIDASNSMHWYVGGGNLHAQKHVAGAFSDVRNNLAYNPSRHQYFRIRESGGTIFWDTSPDGYGWENYTSLANPFAVTSCTIIVQAGTFASEANATFMLVDNINVTAEQNQMRVYNPGRTWVRRFAKAKRHPYFIAKPLAVTNIFTQSFTASLGFTGSSNNKTNKSLSGGLSFTGAFTKKTFKILTAAALSFTGSFSKAFTHLVSFTASLGFTGSINRKATKSLTGGLSFTGSTPIKTIFHKMTGGLSFTGTSNRRTTKTLSGGLSFTGTLTRKILKALGSGILSFTGVFTKGNVFHKVFTAALSFTGNFSTLKAFTRSFTASLSFTGSFKKQTNKNFTGGISFTGTFKRLVKKTFVATVGFTGFYVKKIIKAPFTASIGFLGSFTALLAPHFKVISRILSSFTGNSELDSTQKTATIDTANKIAEVNSSATIGEATSSSPAGTPQSENSSGTVETTNTNETLD